MVSAKFFTNLFSILRGGCHFGSGNYASGVDFCANGLVDDGGGGGGGSKETRPLSRLNIKNVVENNLSAK